MAAGPTFLGPPEISAIYSTGLVHTHGAPSLLYTHWAPSLFYTHGHRSFTYSNIRHAWEGQALSTSITEKYVPAH